MLTLILDEDHDKSSKLHCISHRNKLIVEAAQQLYTSIICHWKLNITVLFGKKYVINPNHGSTLWTCACLAHFRWVLNQALALCARHNTDAQMHLTTHHLEHVAEWLESNIDAVREKVKDVLTLEEYGPALVALGVPEHAVVRAISHPMGTAGLPKGCLFAPVMPSVPLKGKDEPWHDLVYKNCFRGRDGEINVVASYRAIVAMKYVVGLGVDMVWDDLSGPPLQIASYCHGFRRIIKASNKRKRDS